MRFPQRQIFLRYNVCVLASLLALVLPCASSAATAVETDRALPSPGAHADAAIKLARRAAGEVQIQLDGKLDEAIWSELPVYDQMTITTPDTGEPAPFRTQTRLFYTERGLYVGAKLEQPPDTLKSRLAGRDAFINTDAFQILIDSSGKGLYGYWFQVKLGGSLADGTLLPERKFQNNWDGPWRGQSSKTADGWTAEMYLPWSMINMPVTEGDKRLMGLLIVRDLGKRQETWSWPALPSTQPRFLSAFQPVELEQVAPRQDVSVFPYVAYTEDRIRDEGEGRVGADLFWRPSSAFFVSGTVNPDFGQVEADNVVVNLTAFETFFPENQDVFNTTGSGYSSGTTLLHTRRIGSSVGSRRGSPDFGATPFEGFDISKPVDLVAAAKTVAQRGRSRFALLAAVEDDTRLAHAGAGGASKAPGRDFAVLRYQFEDGSTGGRRAIGWMGTYVRHPDRTAEAHVIDTHFQTADARWAADAEFMFSRVDDAAGTSSGAGGIGNIKYVPKRGVQHLLQVEHHDDEIELNDLGFLRRNDFTSAFYEFWRRRQDYKKIRSTNWWLFVRGDVNGDGKLVNGFTTYHHGVTFNNNTGIAFTLHYNPKHRDDRNSRGNGTFSQPERHGLNLNWNSSASGRLSANGGVGYWKESFGGEQQFANAFFNYNPVDRISMTLGLGYVERDSWLIWQENANFSTFRSRQWSPRVGFGVFLTARQQLQLDLQWVGIKAAENQRYVVTGTGPLRRVDRPAGVAPSSFAISNLVLQLRYRWQIAPLSDLFVVYNRGGGVPGATVADGFGDLLGDAFSDPTQDALVLKLRYRFGLTD